MPTEDELEQLVNEALGCGITAERIKQLAEEAAGVEPSDELLGMYKSYCEELSKYDDTEYPEGQPNRFTGSIKQIRTFVSLLLPTAA